MLHQNNRLFTLARQGQRQPSLLVAIAVVPILLAFLIAGQVVARISLRPIFPGEIQSVADPIAEIIGFLSVYLGLWILLQFRYRRPLESLGFEQRRVLPRILGGALAGGLMVVAMTGLVVISGGRLAPGELRTNALAALGSGLMTLVATGVQSSAEEALFRGWLLGVIGARYGAWIGVLVSSLLFMLAHATTGPPPLGWLSLFLFGALAALWALAEGGLWGACAWHAGWNWTLGGLLGLTVDRSSHPGLLLSVRANGPDFITGGAFGPEGGAPAAVVLLIGIGILALQTRRSR